MVTTVAVQRAVLTSELPAPARHVLLTLCVRADFQTAVIPDEHTPSLTDLKTETGLSRSTVARSLNLLEGLKWVERDRPEVDKARAEGARTRYRLMIGGSPTQTLVPERHQPDQDTLDTRSGPTVTLVPQGDQPDQDEPDTLLPDLVPQGHQVWSHGDTRPSPTVTPINRKTPTGSTQSSSHTSLNQPSRKKRAPRPARDPNDIAVATTTTQTIIGEWIDRCRRRPPGQVIGQLSANVKKMLEEGIDPDDIRAGIDIWRTKDLSPGTLPSIVNGVMNGARASPGTALALPGGQPRPSTTDQRVAAALALAESLEEP